MSLLFASTAAAAPCDSDADCGHGSFCDSGAARSANMAVAGCASGEPCTEPAPAPPECKPLPQGYCEELADCADGLECRKDRSWSNCGGDHDGGPGFADLDASVPRASADASLAPSGAFAPDAGGANCVGEPAVLRYGRCELPIVACEEDTECLSGLYCISYEWNGARPDGGVVSAADASLGDSSRASLAAEPPAVAPEAVAEGGVTPPGASSGQCAYSEKTCAQNTDCAAGYECAPASTDEWCEGGGGCSADAGTCSAPAEPVCHVEVTQICYPQKTPCESDASCTGGWKCTTFTNADGGLATPAWWDAKGTVKSCLPPGLAALAGTARGLHYAGRQVSSLPDQFENWDVVSDGSGDPRPAPWGGDASVGAEPIGPVPGGDASVGAEPIGPVPGGGSVPGNHEPVTVAQNPGEGSNQASSSSSCSVGFTGGAPSSAFAVLAGLLGLVSRRRRRG